MSPTTVSISHAFIDNVNKPPILTGRAGSRQSIHVSLCGTENTAPNQHSRRHFGDAEC